MDPALPPYDNQARFELMDQPVQNESGANSPHTLPAESSPAPFKSSSTPIPSTETADPEPTPKGPSALNGKKKGTASTVKKAPKKPKNGVVKKPKSAKPRPSTAPDAMSDEDASDNGPYCLCRGPDDHRWMIFCENCEDWFHGECVNLNKDVGENLVEKFICPNCSDGNLVTMYKKTCGLGSCRKPARLSQDMLSVFCSNEHANTWWERLVARLPKTRSKTGLTDQMTQDELMVILQSGMLEIREDGTCSVKAPFLDPVPIFNGDGITDDSLSEMLSEEEKAFLESSADARQQLADETLLCHKMLSVLEMVQDRRRAAIKSGRFAEDICGYDNRLDTICARDAFAAFVKSPEGEEIFKESKVDDPLAEGDPVRGMCERKRCKVHAGWQKMLPLGINYQIREMAGQAAEMTEEERIVRQAVGERRLRKKAERNWVEVIDG